MNAANSSKLRKLREGPFMQVGVVIFLLMLVWLKDIIFPSHELPQIAFWFTIGMQFVFVLLLALAWKRKRALFWTSILVGSLVILITLANPHDREHLFVWNDSAETIEAFLGGLILPMVLLILGAKYSRIMARETS